MTSLEGVLVYNYRLVNALAADVEVNAFLASVTPGVTRSICTTPDTRDKFLKEGITLRYSYVDKAGVQIASFDVSKADCGT